MKTLLTTAAFAVLLVGSAQAMICGIAGVENCWDYPPLPDYQPKFVKTVPAIPQPPFYRTDRFEKNDVTVGNGQADNLDKRLTGYGFPWTNLHSFRPQSCGVHSVDHFGLCEIPVMASGK